jgi:hypothetical protein
MKSIPKNTGLKALWILCVLCGSVWCCALDREAFSITNYDLNAQVDPEQHRLGVRGKITLRNDRVTSQNIAVLQVSSSLDWRSIRAGEKPLQFVRQPYTSDVDHTGSLSEAIVTLPQEVAPHGTIDLEIAYEGVVVLDATRLTRIGAPEDAAKNTDWDQIAPDFTAVRGAGYVAWYPIATDVANLSEGDSLFEVLARWKAREARSQAHMKISLSRNSETPPVELVVDDPLCIVTRKESGQEQRIESDCTFHSLQLTVPSFAIADYGTVDRNSITIYNLRGHAAAAEASADAAEKVAPLVSEWFGHQREKAQTIDLPDGNAAPFEIGTFRFTPLGRDTKLAGLAAAHQLAHASVSSPRPWIEEGLAHFAQALYLEQEKGRQAALDYLGTHRSALNTVEPSASAPRSEEGEANHSLINTVNEELYRSKAMCVWWMLRDMLGDAALKKAIAAYKPEQDKEPSYMPRLISAQTQRDLEWFFDDWVYRDHRLPDFKVVAAYAQKTMNGSFMLTITLENQGGAGAEVPVLIRSVHGDVTKRIEVRAKRKTTVRVEMPAAPQEIVVNDGSVPESETKDNVFKVAAPQT